MTSESRDSFLAKIQATPSPTRAETNRRHLIWVAGALLGALAVYLAIVNTPRYHHTDIRPFSLWLETSLGSTAIAALAVWVVVGGRSMLGRSTSVLLGVVLLTPLVLLLWKNFITGSAVYGISRPGLKCLELSLATAISPLIALVVLRRGSDPVHPVATGAALGAATGAGSWVMVDLWCPLSNLSHLLFGHVLPIAILALLGAAMGGMFVRVKAD
jgi:Negative regulator of sigma F